MGDGTFGRGASGCGQWTFCPFSCFLLQLNQSDGGSSLYLSFSHSSKSDGSTPRGDEPSWYRQKSSIVECAFSVGVVTVYVLDESCDEYFCRYGLAKSINVGFYVANIHSNIVIYSD